MTITREHLAQVAQFYRAVRHFVDNAGCMDNQAALPDAPVHDVAAALREQAEIEMAQMAARADAPPPEACHEAGANKRITNSGGGWVPGTSALRTISTCNAPSRRGRQPFASSCVCVSLSRRLQLLAGEGRVRACVVSAER